MDQIEPYLRRKWLIIALSIVGAAVGVAVALYLPKMYRSSTMILVEAQQVSERYVELTEVTPFQQRLSTLKQQIMSRTNLLKIINNFDLYDGKDITKEQKIESMRKNIEINIIGSTRRSPGDAFSVGYINNNPNTAMEVTNTLAFMFIEENLKLREQSVEGTSDFISREVESARLKLAKQEEMLKAFKDQHMGALPTQLDANLRTLDRLQLELQSIQGNLRNASDRKALLERSSHVDVGGDTVAGTSSSPLSSIKADLDISRNQLSQLLVKYTDNYPDVIILKKRIVEMEKSIALEEKAVRDSDQAGNDSAISNDNESVNREVNEELFLVNSEISTLERRARRIRSEMKTYGKRVEETSANEQSLADITRDYTISYRNYESLLEKKLNAELAENLEKRQKGERFRIIDPAYLPEKPFKPMRELIVLMGLAGGLVFGIGLIFLLEKINPAIRRPEELEEILGLPVLTIIPDYSTVESDRERKRNDKELKLLKGGKN